MAHITDQHTSLRTPIPTSAAHVHSCQRRNNLENKSLKTQPQRALFALWNSSNTGDAPAVRVPYSVFWCECLEHTTLDDTPDRIFARYKRPAAGRETAHRASDRGTKVCVFACVCVEKKNALSYVLLLVCLCEHGT